MWIDDGSELENNIDMFVDEEDADTVDFLWIEDWCELENVVDMREEKKDAVSIAWKDVELDLEAIDM